MKKNLTRISIFLILLVITYFLLQYYGITKEDFTKENIEKITNGNKLLILITIFGLMLSQNIINFFPMAIIIGLNLLLFGPFLGFMISFIFNTVTSFIVFYVVRKFTKKDKDQSEKIKKYREKINKKGFIYIVILKVVPIMPTNIINIVCGISEIKKRKFFFAALLGNFIYTSIFVYIIGLF